MGAVPWTVRVGIVAAALVGVFAGRGAAGTDGPAVGIVVVKEHGVGSAALAQPYLDRLAALAAAQNGWSGAQGQYFTTRDQATAFIDARRPHYGILSLPVFLALRGRYDLEVIGQVAVSLAGGRQYHLISRTAADLAGCKGKPLASDHTDDRRFVERVVAAGSFTLADFTLVQTQRPLQAVKKVLDGEATCALVDDAQLADLAHIEGAGGVRSVWHSAELPPMPVVAFPAAPRAERDAFRDGLHEICTGDGKGACNEVGIVSLAGAGMRDYTGVVTAYGR